MFTHEDNPLIALSCMTNQPQFPRFHRSTQNYHVDESSNQDGYISLYIQNKDKLILLYHILHHKSYFFSNLKERLRNQKNLLRGSARQKAPRFALF